MRKSFALVTSLAMLALVAPAAPAVAATAPVAEVIKISAPYGANKACPRQTVKYFKATVKIKRGHIVRPGSFTLVMKNGDTRTERGSVVLGTNRHVAEYFIFVDRKARIKMGARHTFRLKVNKKWTLSTASLTKDCMIAE